MINIPLNAKVECTDGLCGYSSYIIADPVARTLTHVVVKEQGMPAFEYMVPIDQVVETETDLIRLGCTKSELQQMEQFAETEFIETEYYVPYYGQDTMMVWPYSVPERMMVPVEHQRIPPGELAVGRGARVQATDGQVGQVDEFLVDPDTGHITHLVLREGHLWGDKVVTLPISAIDYTEQENVYLKLDKQTIESLPAIPVKQSYGLTDLELIILTFKEVGQANEALQTLKQSAQKGVLTFLNAAVLVKEEDGQTSLKETEDIDPKRGALFGAITGGLIGLLGGPVGVIIGATAGAVTGREAAKRIDTGFSEAYLKKLQEGLQPGSSALVTLVEQEGGEKVTETLAEFEGQLLRQALTDDLVAHLTTGTEEDETD